MLRPVALLIDLHDPLHQRLRLRQPLRGVIQLREVVEVSGDIGMLRPVAFLIDLQGPLHQRLRLRQPVRVLIQLREVVEHGALGLRRHRLSRSFEFLLRRLPLRMQIQDFSQLVVRPPPVGRVCEGIADGALLLIGLQPGLVQPGLHHRGLCELAALLLSALAFGLERGVEKFQRRIHPAFLEDRGGLADDRRLRVRGPRCDEGHALGNLPLRPVAPAVERVDLLGRRLRGEQLALFPLKGLVDLLLQPGPQGGRIGSDGLYLRDVVTLPPEIAF